MTPDERRHGTSKSGWCLRLGRPDCEHCKRPECTCACHSVAAQADSARIGYNGLGNDERPPAVTEDRSSHSDSPIRKEGVGSW